MDLWRVPMPSLGKGASISIMVCPGCGTWQVENEHAFSHGLLVTLQTLDAVDNLIHDHRTECPGLDMLLGLAGLTREEDHQPI